MTKTMKNLLALALMAGIVLFAGAALADNVPAQNGGNGGFFGDAATRFMNTFKSVRTMVLIFGGFGLVVLAVAAILGKVKWAALGALAAGLAIVAVAGKVVDYATKGSQTEVTDFNSQELGDLS